MSDDRIARFEERRVELSALSDEQLKEHFWSLCAQLVDPIVALARTHTSPSIERSVLLRMGVDSLTSQAVVKRVYEAGLLGMGEQRSEHLDDVFVGVIIIVQQHHGQIRVESAEGEYAEFIITLPKT